MLDFFLYLTKETLMKLTTKTVSIALVFFLTPILLGFTFTDKIKQFFSGKAATEHSISLNAEKNMPFTIQSTTVDGKLLNTKDYFGKILIVNFWATWCPPCIKEIPDFIDIQNEFKNDVQFIGISVDSKEFPVKNFIRKGVNYPIIMNNASITAQPLFSNITSVPTTFIFDKDHSFVEVIVGLKPKSYFVNKIRELSK